ncbi:MAG TPA: SAM-dependent methyltransferase, partial [Flavobacterium sp.]|nr:SAM-dependent methyltransferase [Flavobacterium sp.]
MDKKAHWENIYTTKQADEVSWYQPGAQTSVEFVNRAGLSPEASIIDIGGGDSYFAEQLLDNGFKDITVVDISSA